MNAVVASGSSSMSDSWICWKPRMDEPSKATPSVKTLSSNETTGTVKCCMTPGRSQKRTSRNFTPSSVRYRSSWSGPVNIRPSRLWGGPWAVRPADTTLITTGDRLRPSPRRTRGHRPGVR